MMRLFSVFPPEWRRVGICSGSSSFVRFFFFVFFVVVGSATTGGCLEAEADPPPPPCGCQSDRDCGAGASCRLDAGGCGTCAPVFCVSDSECEGDDLCDFARGLCMPPLVCSGGDPRAGCADDELCLVDADQGGCVVTPTAARCEVVPAQAVATAGVARTFDVIAFDGDGALLPHTAARSVSGDGVVVGADGSGILLPRCPGPDPCDVVVDAAAFGASCSAAVRVLPSLDPAGPLANQGRVVVVDQRSGAPVAGAHVLAAVAGVIVEAVTDDDGAAVFADVALFDHVSVFVDGFEGLTVVAPGGVDVQLPLRRVGLVATAGEVVVGDAFLGDVAAALAGLSYDGVEDVSALALFGASGTITVDISGITASGGEAFPFSSGGTLVLGNTALRSRYVAVGAPGERLLWSFGARQSLGVFGSLVVSLRPDADVDVRLEMLRASAGRAKSGVAVARSGAIAAPPPGADLDTFGDDLPTLARTDVEASARSAAALEVVLAGVASDVSDVIVAVAAAVPGRGLVLLGGTVIATVDEFDRPGFAPGSQPLFFARPHDGLEGFPLVVLALDVRVDRLRSSDELGRNRRRLPLSPPTAGAGPALVVVPALNADDLGGFDGNVLDVRAAARLRARRNGQTWTIAAPAGARIDVRALAAALDAGARVDFSGGVDFVDVAGDAFVAGKDPETVLAQLRQTASP